MKLTLTPLYVLSFLSLVFLVHEMHDWAHVIAAKDICGCWGSRVFDGWTFCSNCGAELEIQAMAYFAGPLVSYLIVWIGWWLMDPRSSPKRKSLGFSLLFAALPFSRILAAASGGGDETLGLRQVFQQEDGSNHHIVALSGLVLVLALTVIPLIRALRILPGWLPRILVFIPFLVVPMYPDRWVVSIGMNKLLASGFLSESAWTGTPVLVIAWSVFLLTILFFTRRSLPDLFKARGKSTTI